MANEIIDQDDEGPDERATAWRMVTELYNRPTWPTGMWAGSPADAARQLSEFGDLVVELATPVRHVAPFLVDRAVQLVRSATVCAGLLGDHDTERVRTPDRARALCAALAPFAAVADQVLNDLVDQYGFRAVLTPTSAQRRNQPPGHEGFAHHALDDGVRALVYWSTSNYETHQTDNTSR
jgi:hypothetical protein